jgi:uncharacterized protein YpuA (DUF1002 family)
MTKWKNKQKTEKWTIYNIVLLLKNEKTQKDWNKLKNKLENNLKQFKKFKQNTKTEKTHQK